MYTWGKNDLGQLGDGTTIGRTQIRALDGKWTDISTTLKGVHLTSDGFECQQYNNIASSSNATVAKNVDGGIYFAGTYDKSNSVSEMFSNKMTKILENGSYNGDETPCNAVVTEDLTDFSIPSDPATTTILQPNGSIVDGKTQVMPGHVFQQAGFSDTEYVGLDQAGVIWIANKNTPTEAAKLTDKIRFTAIAVGADHTLALGDPITSTDTGQKYAGQMPSSGDPAASWHQQFTILTGIAVTALALTAWRASRKRSI